MILNILIIIVLAWLLFEIVEHTVVPLVWLVRDAVDVWTPPKNGKRGGQPIYSDIAIETSLTIRLVFHLPLRQAEGFLKSLCSYLPNLSI
jgi:hypothetical protein